MSLEQRPWQPIVGSATFFRSLVGWCALLAGLSAAAAPARAASEESRERAAKKACLAGDAAKGVAILAELYVRTNDPVFIFNQGRCFEQNGKYEEAVIRFREFQQKNQDAGHGSDLEADRHIEKCQALLDAQKQREKGVPTSPPTPPPSVPAAPVTTVAPAVPSAAAPVVAPPAEAREAAGISTESPQMIVLEARPAVAGSGLRIAGIVVAAVGAAGIATGIMLNLKANSLASDIETELPYQRSRENTRASYETWSWVSYGAGVACLAGGAVLYYLGYSKGRPSQVALVPSVAAGSVGGTLQGAF